MFDLIYRFDPANSEPCKTPLDSEEARVLLARGNRDFAEMTDACRLGTETRIIRFDPRAFGWGVAQANSPTQAPFAAVLGCADARVPTEMVLSKGCNGDVRRGCKGKPGYRSAPIEIGVVLNAAWSAFCLQQEFKPAFASLDVVFGAYEQRLNIGVAKGCSLSSLGVPSKGDPP